MTQEPLRRGDEVELVSVPLGRAGRLKVGMLGVVIEPPDGQEFHWVSVLFPPALRPHLLAQRHLRRTGAHQELDGES